MYFTLNLLLFRNRHYELLILHYIFFTTHIIKRIATSLNSDATQNINLLTMHKNTIVLLHFVLNHYTNVHIAL